MSKTVKSIGIALLSLVMTVCLTAGLVVLLSPAGNSTVAAAAEATTTLQYIEATDDDLSYADTTGGVKVTGFSSDFISKNLDTSNAYTQLKNRDDGYRIRVIVPATHGGSAVKYIAEDAFINCIDVADINIKSDSSGNHAYFQVTKAYSMFKTADNLKYATKDGNTFTIATIDSAGTYNGNTYYNLIMPSPVWYDENSNGVMDSGEKTYEFTECLHDASFANKMTTVKNFLITNNVINIYAATDTDTASSSEGTAPGQAPNADGSFTILPTAVAADTYEGSTSTAVEVELCDNETATVSFVHASGRSVVVNHTSSAVFNGSTYVGRIQIGGGVRANGARSIKLVLKEAVTVELFAHGGSSGTTLSVYKGSDIKTSDGSMSATAQQTFSLAPSGNSSFESTKISLNAGTFYLGGGATWYIYAIKITPVAASISANSPMAVAAEASAPGYTGGPSISDGLRKMYYVNEIHFATGRTTVLSIYSMTFESYYSLQYVSLSAGVLLADGAGAFQESTGIKNIYVAQETNTNVPTFYLIGSDGALYTNAYSYEYYTQAGMKQYLQWRADYYAEQALGSASSYAGSQATTPVVPAPDAKISANSEVMAIAAKVTYEPSNPDNEGASGSIAIPKGSVVFDPYGVADGVGSDFTKLDTDEYYHDIKRQYPDYEDYNIDLVEFSRDDFSDGSGGYKSDVTFNSNNTYGGGYISLTIKRGSSAGSTDFPLYGKEGDDSATNDIPINVGGTKLYDGFTLRENRYSAEIYTPVDATLTLYMSHIGTSGTRYLYLKGDGVNETLGVESKSSKDAYGSLVDVQLAAGKTYTLTSDNSVVRVFLLIITPDVVDPGINVSVKENSVPSYSNNIYYAANNTVTLQASANELLTVFDESQVTYSISAPATVTDGTNPLTVNNSGVVSFSASEWKEEYAGVYTVTASYSNGSDTYTESIEINLAQYAPFENIVVKYGDSEYTEDFSIILGVGSTNQFSYSVNLGVASAEISVTTTGAGFVTFDTSESGIVKMTGISEGSETVTLTCGGKTLNVTVSVKDVATGIKAVKSWTSTDENSNLSGTITVTVEATGTPVVYWYSSCSGVVSVTEQSAEGNTHIFNIKALGTGATRLTFWVAAENANGYIAASVDIVLYNTITAEMTYDQVIRYQRLVLYPPQYTEEGKDTPNDYFEFSNTATTEIGAQAFLGTQVSVIVIPDRVTSIGSAAFRFSDKLQTVYLPSNATYGSNIFGFESDAENNHETKKAGGLPDSTYTAGKNNFTLVAASRLSYEEFLRSHNGTTGVFANNASFTGTFNYIQYLTYEMEVTFCTVDEDGNTLSEETRTYLYGRDATYVKVTQEMIDEQGGTAYQWATDYNNNQRIYYYDDNNPEREVGGVTGRFNRLPDEADWTIAVNGWVDIACQNTEANNVPEAPDDSDGWHYGTNQISKDYGSTTEAFNAFFKAENKNVPKDYNDEELDPNHVGDYMVKVAYKALIEDSAGTKIDKTYYLLPYGFTLTSVVNEDGIILPEEVIVPTFQSIFEVSGGFGTELPTVTVEFDFNGYPASRFLNAYDENRVQIDYVYQEDNGNFVKSYLPWGEDEENENAWLKPTTAPHEGLYNSYGSDTAVPYDSGTYLIRISIKQSSNASIHYSWLGTYMGEEMKVEDGCDFALTFRLIITPREVQVDNARVVLGNGEDVTVYENNAYYYVDWNTGVDGYVPLDAQGNSPSDNDYDPETAPSLRDETQLPYAQGTYSVTLGLRDPKYMDDSENTTPNLNWVKGGVAQPADQENVTVILIIDNSPRLYFPTLLAYNGGELGGIVKVDGNGINNGVSTEYIEGYEIELATTLTYEYDGNEARLDQLLTNYNRGVGVSTVSVRYINGDGDDTTIANGTGNEITIRAVGTYTITVAPGDGYNWKGLYFGDKTVAAAEPKYGETFVDTIPAEDKVLTYTINVIKAKVYPPEARIRTTDLNYDPDSNENGPYEYTLPAGYEMMEVYGYAPVSRVDGVKEVLTDEYIDGVTLHEVGEYHAYLKISDNLNEYGEPYTDCYEWADDARYDEFAVSGETGKHYYGVYEVSQFNFFDVRYTDELMVTSFYYDKDSKTFKDSDGEALAESEQGARTKLTVVYDPEADYTNLADIIRDYRPVYMSVSFKDAGGNVLKELPNTVGEYTITFTLDPTIAVARGFTFGTSENDTTTDPKVLVLEIVPATVENPGDKTVTELTDGAAEYEVPEDALYSVVSYKSVADGTVTTTAPTKAGKYYVTLELNDKDNYVWDTGDDSNSGQVTVILTVGAGLEAPAPQDNTYTGESFDLKDDLFAWADADDSTDKGYIATNGVTIVSYTKPGATVAETTAPSSVTNAGTYVLKITLDDTKAFWAYNWLTSGETLSVPEGIEVVESDLYSITIKITIDQLEIAEIELSGSAIYTGETITILTDDGALSSNEIELSIDKAVDASNNNLSLALSDLELTSSIKNVLAEGYTFAKTSGDTNILVEIKADSNFKLAANVTISGTFEVKRRTIDIDTIISEIAAVTYNGSAQTASELDSFETGYPISGTAEVLYNTTNYTVSYGDTDAINAGEYTVTVTLNWTSETNAAYNYCFSGDAQSTDLAASFVINKAQVTALVLSGNATYTGSTITLLDNGAKASDVTELKIDSASYATTTSVAIALSDLELTSEVKDVVDGGYTFAASRTSGDTKIAVSIKAASNFALATDVSISGTFTVNPAEITAVYTQGSDVIYYDTTEHGISEAGTLALKLGESDLPDTLTEGDTNGYVITYAISGTAGSLGTNSKPVGAGAYTVSIELQGKAASNYKISGAEENTPAKKDNIGTLTISKIDLKLTGSYYGELPLDVAIAQNGGSVALSTVTGDNTLAADTDNDKVTVYYTLDNSPALNDVYSNKASGEQKSLTINVAVSDDVKANYNLSGDYVVVSSASDFTFRIKIVGSSIVEVTFYYSETIKYNTVETVMSDAKAIASTGLTMQYNGKTYYVYAVGKTSNGNYVLLTIDGEESITDVNIDDGEVAPYEYGVGTSDEYTLASSLGTPEASVTITPVVVEVAFTNTTITYNGANHYNTITGSYTITGAIEGETVTATAAVTSGGDTVINVGTYTVTVTLSDTNYATAYGENVTYSITATQDYEIVAAEVTLNITGSTTYTGSDINLSNLTLTLSATYNVEMQNGAAIAQSDLTFTTVKNVGDYTFVTEAGTGNVIVVTITNSNYKFASTAFTSDSKFTVTPATITVTVTVNDTEITYGDVAPGATVTYTGYIGEDDESVISNKSTLSTTYVQYESGVGSYSYTLSESETAANYVFEYVYDDVTFTVTKATITVTVTVNDTEITYGDVAPGARVEYTGYVGEDDESVISNKSTLSTEYVQYTSGVGSYSYTLNESETADNYIFTYNYEAAEFEVTKATITVTVTVNDTEITYGDVAPGATVTYTGYIGEDDESVISNKSTLSTTYVQYESGVGSYSYTLSQSEAADNYIFTYNYEAATFTVTKATITVTVTVNDTEITYGDVAPGATVSYTGFVGEDDESVISSKSTLSTNYVQYTSGVGSYSYTLSQSETAANYVFTYVYDDVTFTVTPAELTVSYYEDKVDTTKSVDYKATEYTDEYNEVYFDGLVGDDATGFIAYTVTVTAFNSVSSSDIVVKNAGTYMITVTLVNGNYTFGDAAAQATLTFTIEKVELEVSYETLTYTYDAQEHSEYATAVTFDGLKGDDQFTEDSDYTVTVTAFNNVSASDIVVKNAATYTVTITLVNGNYTFKANGADTAEATLTFTIEKADLTVTAADVAVANKSYDGNGTAQASTAKDYLTGQNSENVAYAIESATFVDSTNKFNAAEGYSVTVTVKLVNDTDIQNYNLVGNPVTVTGVYITPATITASASDLTVGDSKVYDGNSNAEDIVAKASTTLEGVNGEEVEYEIVSAKFYDADGNEVSNAGEGYTVKVVIQIKNAQDQANYKFSDTEPTYETTLTYESRSITKAEITDIKWYVDGNETSGTHTYKGGEFTVTAYGICDDTEIELNVVISAGESIFKNAGDYTFTASLNTANGDSNNFDVSSLTLTKDITVTPATLSVYYNDNKDTTKSADYKAEAYTTEYNDVYFEGLVGDDLGSFTAYAVKATEYNSEAANDIVVKNAGDYKVEVKLSTANYVFVYGSDTSDVDYLTFTVNKIDIKLEGAYAGQMPLDIAINSGAGSVALNTLSGMDALKAATDSDKVTVYYTLVDSNGSPEFGDVYKYQGTEGKTLTLNISVSDDVKDNYNLNGSYVKLDGDSEFTFQITIVNSSIVSIDFYISKTETYTSVDDITGADDVDAIDAQRTEVDYDGTAYYVYAIGTTAVGNSVWLSINGGEADIADNGFENVKVSSGAVAVYTLTASVDSGYGYNLNSGEYSTIYITVLPIQVTVSFYEAAGVDGNEITYNGANNYSTITGYTVSDANGIVDGISELDSSVATDITNVGDYTVKINITNTNYAIYNSTSETYEFSAEKTYIINKATITVTVTVNKDSIVYGEAAPGATVTYSGYVGEDDESVISNKSTLSTNYVQYTSGVGSYSYTLNESETAANYVFTYVYTDSTFTVTKATITVTVTVNKDSITYGEAAPGTTVTYSGYVGNDGESVISNKSELSTSYVQYESGVGSYSYTLNESETADNYIFTYNYEAAEFEVTKATITVTVTVNKDSIVYGEAAPGATVMYSGYIGEDDESVISNKSTLSTTYVQYESGVGSYSYTLSESETAANYVFEYVYDDVTFTVTPATITVTVTVNADSIVYGDVAPGASVEYTGYVGEDDESVISNKSTLSTNYVQYTSGVGSYSYTLNESETVANYVFTYVYTDSTFTVTKATITVTVTVNKDSIVYGEAAPGATVSYTGFVGEDNESVISNKSTLSTSYVQYESGVGSYSYTLNESETADNYVFTYNYAAAEFEVTPATITVTVTVNKDSIVYGDVAPGATVTYTGFVGEDGESVISNKSELSTNYVQYTSGVGSYSYMLSESETAANYVFTYNYEAAEFEVTKATIHVTVSLKNSERGYDYGEYEYGETPDIVIVYNAQDFLGEDTISVVTKATYSTNFSATNRDVGSNYYYIFNENAEAANYKFEYTVNDLTFSVVAKEITVIWGELENIYTGKHWVPEASFDNSLLEYNDIVELEVNVKGGGTAIALGEYIAVATIVGGNNNYKLVNDEVGFEISGKLVTRIIWYGSTTVVYNGKDIERPAAAVELSTGEIEYNYPVLGEVGKDVGSYIFYVVEGGEYIFDNGVVTEFTVTVKPATVDLNKQLISKVYNPAGYGISVVKEEIVLTWAGGKLELNSDYTVSGATSIVNVGTYTYTITLKSANFTFSSGSTTSVLFRIKAATVEINKTTVTREYDPAGYTKSEVEDEIVLTWNGETLVLNKDYTVSGEAAVNAGSYRYTVTLKSSNLTFGDSQKAYVTLEITKKGIAKPVGDDTAFVYNGESQTYDVYKDVANAPDASLYVVRNNERTNYGAQTVTVALADKFNYTWSDGTNDNVTFTFFIDKAQATIVSVQNSSVEYDGNVHNVTVTVEGEWVEQCEITYTYNGKIAEPVAAGTYKVKVVIPETENYKGDEKEVDFTITAKKIEVNWDGASFDVDDEVKTPYGGLKDGASESLVKVTYATESGITLASAPSGVGKYHVKVTLATDNGNYELVGTTEMDFEITTTYVEPPVVEPEPPVVEPETDEGNNWWSIWLIVIAISAACIIFSIGTMIFYIKKQ